MNRGTVTAPVYARHYRYNDVGLYLQDTWKASRRLTLTPGLRWDYFGPPYSEERERQLDINFYPGAGSTPRQQIANGQFAQVEKAPGEFKGHFYLPTYANFGPRIGAAYSLGQKMVLRSGFGLFYDRIFNNAISSTIENPLVLGFARLGTDPTNLADFKALAGQSLRDVYKLFSEDTNYQLSLNGTAIDPNFKPAYLATWNVTFEKEIHNMVMAASYVGSRSKRLFSANNVNRDRTNGRADVGRLLLVNSKGESSYQAMQLRADSRFLEKYGLIFSFNYTLGRSTDTSSAFFDSNALVRLDEESGLDNFNNLSFFETNTFGRGSVDPFNPQLDRGPSDFDVTHRVATNFVWDLPFGKSFNQRTAKRFFTGWTLSGIVTVQGGRPFSVIDTTGSNVAGLGASVRPRLTGSLPQPTMTASPAQPNVFLYLPLSNPYNIGGVGTTVTPFSLGPSLNGPYDGILGRNTFRSPGIWTTDIAALRNVSLSRVKEGAQLQLRAEFYNLFNHANLFVNPLSVDILRDSFRTTQSGPRVPGVTASFGGVPRQIILAAKFLF